jgi:glucose-6-phosphate isomerase
MPADTAEWRELAEHASELRRTHLRDLFDADVERGSRFVLELDGIYFDYSKNLITDKTLQLLTALADRCGFAARRDSMFAGDPVNSTERRPALHIALRAAVGDHINVAGVDVVHEVHQTLNRMAEFADGIRSGNLRGATGKPFQLVVNIGIGGSDLGPRVAYEALHDRVPESFPIRFVSNIDPVDITRALRSAEPETTMFVVSSKTFTTAETMTNAAAARQWLEHGLPDGADWSRHMAGVTGNAAAAAAFGITPDRVFPVPEWVGGRYSYDSAVGLALLAGIGPAAFREMLAGARSVDRHFREAPLDRNIPALLGLLGIWNANFLGCGSYAVLPYSTRLASLPAHLQQLEMESNGKRVTLDGAPVSADTAPVTWGQPGTNGQHAFYQMLHQGTRVIPVDFIVARRSDTELPGQHRMLVANAVAQSAALAFGKTADEVAGEGIDAALVPHRTFPGNRPSTTIVLDEITPYSFGQLVTLYEHKAFTQGTVWQINSFDQWGVELGKVLASEVDRALSGGPRHAGVDSSTAGLISHYLAQKPSDG